MNLDADPRMQPEGTYREAENIVDITEASTDFGKANEKERKKVGQIAGKLVGYHRVPERNYTILFHIDGESSISIFYHDTYEIKAVAKESDYGCEWKFETCKWLGHGHSISKPIAPCNELVLYWSSGCEYWRLNIDDALADHKGRKLECEDVKLLPYRPGPNVKIKKNRGGGQDLPPGAYFAAARAIDANNNKTNWSFIEGPVFLHSESNNPSIEDPSFESVRIEVNSLHADYSKIQIAVIPPSGETAGDIGHIIYSGAYGDNGVSVDYYSTAQHEIGGSINLVDLVRRKNIKVRGCSIMQSNGIAHLNQVLRRRNFNYQQKALQAKVEYTVGLVPAEEAGRIPSLPHDEPVPVGIQWKLEDGTYSPVFVFKGEEGGAGTANVCECPAPPGHTSNSAARTRTYTSYEEALQEYCMTGPVQTTEREDDNPASNCEDATLEPRSTNENSCVDDVAIKEALKEEIDGIQNTPESIEECIDCDTAASVNDLKKQRNIIIRVLENFINYFKTDKEASDDCEVGQHSTIKEAATTLYDEAIRFADKDEEFTSRPIFTKEGVSPGGSDSDDSTTVPPVSGETSSAAPSNKDRDDNCVFDYTPKVIAEGTPGYWESASLYPETLDCDGNPLFSTDAGKPIKHPKMPSVAQERTFISTQAGVESRFEPHNKPDGNSLVFVLGLKISNIIWPDEKDIPKGLRLDENEPFRIVIGERSPHNQTVIWRGYMTSTFKGNIQGSEYAVARHAANSKATIDRHINNDGSRLGEEWDEPIYNVHSPDACMGELLPNADYLKVEGEVHGIGRRYGLIAEGEEPESDKINRLDRVGARSALNLNQFTPYTEEYRCIDGIAFAKADSITQDADIDYPLLGKSRESSIYLQTDSPVPTLTGGNGDKSFIGDGLEHEAPIFDGRAWLVSLKRINKNQYGSIESIKWNTTSAKGRMNQTEIYVWGGDVHIQPWSHRRMSHISDKVGNVLNEDFPQTATEEFLGPLSAKERTVCDYPNRRGYRMKEFLGMWNPQRLPEPGDKKDPKNMANLHPTRGAVAAAEQDGPETDIYFWQTLSHINHLWVETKIKLDCRINGSANLREVYYRNLQGLDLDSSINQRLPEESWLNDFHCEHKQPSVRQSRLKQRIRTFIALGIPAIMAAGLASTSEPLELGIKGLMTGAFIIFWKALLYNVYTNKKIEKQYGFPRCLTDDEGAQDRDCNRGFRDNYCKYSWVFSLVNNLNAFFSMPDPYNTCACDECENPVFTNTVYSSNRQIPESQIDAYRNFESNSYSGITLEDGVIQKIFPWKAQLIALTTDAIKPLQFRQTTIPTSNGDAFAGQGKFLTDPVSVLDGTFAGFGGTQDPNAVIVTPRGPVIIDSEAGRLYLMEAGMRDLTGEEFALSRFFEKNMHFKTGGLRDQMQSDGIHYTMGYDPKLERLLFTKKDGDASFTASFGLTEKRQHWISFHSYIPDFYFWDRDKMFSVESGAIYEHHAGSSWMPCYMTAAVRRDNAEAFTLTSGVLETEVNLFTEEGVLYDRELTFTDVMIWNRFQSMGKVPVIVKDARETYANLRQDNDKMYLQRREPGRWTFDRFIDRMKSADVPVVLPQANSYHILPNTSNIGADIEKPNGDNFSGNYVLFKWGHSATDRELKLYHMLSAINTFDQQLAK